MVVGAEVTVRYWALDFMMPADLTDAAELGLLPDSMIVRRRKTDIELPIAIQYGRGSGPVWRALASDDWRNARRGSWSWGHGERFG